MSFATGVPSAGDGPGDHISVLPPPFAGSSTLFGAFRSQRLSVAGSTLHVVFTSRDRRADEWVLRWLKRSAEAVASYFGGFPVKEVLVFVRPHAHHGQQFGGDGAAIVVGSPPGRDPGQGEDAWIAVHEMVHLGFPEVEPHQRWASEGLATYLEPVIRARAGWIPAEDVWHEFRRRMPEGLPGPADEGLDRTTAWGRIYWGGAIFWLLADVELRARSHGLVSLQAVLQGLLRAGGDTTAAWSMDEVSRILDEAAGMSVVGPLYREHGARPVSTNLADSWRRLGVAADGARDGAPESWIRRAIAEVPGGEEALCLADGRIVDPERGLTSRPMNLTIRAGVIARIGPDEDVSCRGRRIELDGAYLVPGFVDAHTHTFRNPSPTGRGAEHLGRVAFTRRIVRAGVMAVADLGDEMSTLFPARDRLRGESEHAVLLAAAPITVPALPDNRERAAVDVGDAMGVRPAVIKLFYRGGDIESYVRAARGHGFKTVVHIERFVDAMAAAAAGADAITHLEDERVIPDDLVAMMRRQGTISIPTMAVQCDLARIASSPDMLDDRLLRSLVSPALLAEYRAVHAYSADAVRWMRWQRQGCDDNDIRSIGKLSRMRVPILAGSDGDNLGVFQGYSLHREMELLVEGGLSSGEALAAATTRAAGFYGLPWGIDVGRPANLVALDGSPLDDIRNTRRIRLVIYRGRVR
ncbi:MAG: hypothetical protein SF187_02230 [Deltaproteobacteria bacterium]|nr:hypothetical protein [Deltaproteobacteria bacterium]